MNIDFDRLVTSNNQYLTQSLFYEYRFQTKSDYMPFTLREKDFDSYISVYRLYMESDSEYECAKKMLNSWKHWSTLTTSPFFKKELELWREEKAIREAATGIKTVLEAAKDGNVAAAKYLVDRNTSKRVAGRPTKLEIIEEKRKQSRIDSKVSNIIDRMSKYQ